jgi:hypothetical protein
LRATALPLVVASAKMNGFVRRGEVAVGQASACPFERNKKAAVAGSAEDRRSESERHKDAEDRLKPVLQKWARFNFKIR